MRERGTLIVSTASSSKTAQITGLPVKTVALRLLREIMRDEKAAQAAIRGNTDGGLKTGKAG